MNPDGSLQPKAPVTDLMNAQTPEQAERSLQESLDKQKIIRTYESDIAKEIERKKASVVSIAIAESTVKNNSATISNNSSSRTSSPSTSVAGKKMLYAVLSLIFIGGGVAGGYYLYLQSPLAPVTPVKNPTQQLGSGIIAVNKQRTINITGQTANTLRNVINAPTSTSSIPGVGTITEFVFGTRASGASTTTPLTRVSVVNFFTLAEFNAPDTFTRSLTAPWMFGMYQGDSATPFIILTTDFYQNAYAGMLKWESSIVDDFANIFTYPQADTATPGNTVTGRPLASFYGIHGTWSDAVIKNKDVRIFKNDAGNILLMYAFLDKNTLIIAPQEQVIREVIDRIEKRTYVR